MSRRTQYEVNGVSVAAVVEESIPPRLVSVQITGSDLNAEALRAASRPAILARVFADDRAPLSEDEISLLRQRRTPHAERAENVGALWSWAIRTGKNPTRTVQEITLWPLSTCSHWIRLAREEGRIVRHAGEAVLS